MHKILTRWTMGHQNLFLLVSLILLLGWTSEFISSVGDQTNITTGQNASYVFISQTDCLSRTRASQENLVEAVSVEIELPEKDCKHNFPFM